MASAEGRPLDRREPRFEAEPSRNERVLFALSLVGLVAVMGVLLVWAAH